MSKETYTKVGNLKPSLRNLNIVVKVVDLGEPRGVHSRKTGSEHRVAEALVGDETGSVLLSLWDDQINRFLSGDVVEIKNGYTSLFHGSLRLNIGRYGEAAKVDKEIEGVDTDNNLSNKRHIRKPWRAPSKKPFHRWRRK
jgi:replication factor A1